MDIQLRELHIHLVKNVENVQLVLNQITLKILAYAQMVQHSIQKKINVLQNVQQTKSGEMANVNALTVMQDGTKSADNAQHHLHPQTTTQLATASPKTQSTQAKQTSVLNVVQIQLQIQQKHNVIVNQVLLREGIIVFLTYNVSLMKILLMDNANVNLGLFDLGLAVWKLVG